RVDLKPWLRLAEVTLPAGPARLGEIDERRRSSAEREPARPAHHPIARRVQNLGPRPRAAVVVVTRVPAERGLDEWVALVERHARARPRIERALVGVTSHVQPLGLKGLRVK